MSRRVLSVWVVTLVLGIGAFPGSGEEPRSGRWVVLPDSGPVQIRGLPGAKVVDLPAAVDACVAADMAATETPGAAVAVLVDGELVYEQGYGVRRRGGSETVDPRTVFRIGSVTKMMTAAALLQQVEAGRIGLDDPVTDHVPELELAGPWTADLITVRHLLTHTSEFPDVIWDLGPASPDALAQWAGEQGATELHAPPGAFWNYSNPGYALAGLVLERASGEYYRDYTERHVWGPAGMTSATYDPFEVVLGVNWASGHYRDPTTGQWQSLSPEVVDSWWAGPAGWAFATAGDLARWADLLMSGGGSVLQPASAAAMQGRQVWCHYTPDMFYGFGVVADGYNGLDIRYHDGSLVGWGTMLLWVPDRRFAVAVVANTGAPLANAAFCALDAALGTTPVDPPNLTTPPETWRRYQGGYGAMDYLGWHFTAAVRMDGADLLLDVEPYSFLLAPGTYAMTQAFLDTFFVDSDGDGVVDTDMTFIAGGGSPPATRYMRNRYAVGNRQGGVRPGPRGRVGGP